MTVRTIEATVRWAIETLSAEPYHQGARAVLERAAGGSALYAGQAREALALAELARAEQPPPTEPAAGDWPASIRRQGQSSSPNSNDPK